MQSVARRANGSESGPAGRASRRSGERSWCRPPRFSAHEFVAVSEAVCSATTTLVSGGGSVIRHVRPMQSAAHEVQDPVAAVGTLLGMVASSAKKHAASYGNLR